MVKKDSKNPTPKYDSERETRVLLEEIHGQIKLVAEQHGVVIKKLEEHDDKFERIDQRFDRLELAVMENNLQIKGLKVGQEKLEIGQEELRVGQERIEKKLDDSLANHEQRIRKLEEKVSI